MDLRVLKQVLDQISPDYRLTVMIDGQQARDFILKVGDYREFPPADVIFLDMNMPKLTGLEVLREIPDSAELPVCMLTSSERERRSIEQHFAPKKICYLTKPIDREHLLECFQSHEQMWPVARRLRAPISAGSNGQSNN
jgi:CheY-like chemotaxis protein